jgi:hypothetical protein
MVAIPEPRLAAAPASSEESAPPPQLMKINIKVSFAWSNHPSMNHLMHSREIEVGADAPPPLPHPTSPASWHPTCARDCARDIADAAVS